MDKIKQIGFKAGEKPRRSVIQADTSASKSYASIAYGISEGEIVGLVDGAKSIYLDGTPVMSSSGDINIPDVTIHERKGTNDQTYLEGFPAVVNEKQYNNVEMLSSTPFVHYINDTNLDAVGIRFTFGALQSTNPDNGDVSGITIEYVIDVQVDGQGYQELLRTNIVGKYSAGYQRYHRVELPPAEEGWEVRIRRLTPNSTSTYIADKMYLDAVAEILDVKMRYPNTAVIGLKFDSERFSNIPKVDFRMRGKIIRVPANYDPVARTYAKSGAGTTNGIWNGQFKMAYTTNPAWIFYDLVLNKRYGLGNRIDPSMLDKWSLYSIAQYCDVMVPDGEGGLEPRFTCNVYINNRFEAYDCLMQLAGVFRGIMYWSGTAIIAGCDRPQDPVFTYTRANIIGEFNYSGTRTRDRHSVVMVSFDDPKNNYKTDKEVVSDRKAISEIGVRTKDLAAFACTSRGQAQRAGKWALFKEQLETRIVTFALGMDGYIAPVGRVIEIADPLLAGRAVGGRIAAVSADKKTITLDRDTTVKVGDRLVLNNEEGEQESRQVSSVSGRNVTVTVAFDSPAVQHVWAVDSDDLQLMRFTVISVTENRSQDSINFTVTALQHEPALHEVADYSAYIERNNYSVIDITTQKAPAEVLISSNNRINQGIDLTDLVISWKQAENAVKYHVQWRRDDGNWIQMPFQYGNQVTIENIYHGVYEAKVVAINAAEVNSPPTSSLPTPINSKFAEPATLASLTATGILFGIELNWKFPLYGAQNAAYVEIYWAINADKGDEKLLGSYAYPTTETTLNGLSPHQIIHFRARLVDRNGIASEYTPWVTATVIADPDKLLDILNGHIGLAAIDAELAQAIDANTTGVADAKALANQAKTDASNAATKAQEAANAAAQEATDRAAAIAAQDTALKADASAKVAGLKAEIDPKITTLQNGITQVTTDYKAGDTAVVGQLNAYKTSNDSSVASVLQKAESAVSTGSTNSSAITAINGQITTINNTKLDASVINGYYTKGQTDAKAAEIAAGKVEEFKASLIIGGTNLATVNSSVNNRPTIAIGTAEYYREFHTGVKLEAGKKYTFTITVEKMAGYESVPINVHLGVAKIYGGGYVYDLGFNANNIASGKRIVITFAPTQAQLVDSAGTARDWLMFRIRNERMRVDVTFRQLQVEEGSVPTAWSPSPTVIQSALDANSTAIQNTNAEVTRVDGVATAANNATTALAGRISAVEGTVATKADASAVNSLTTRVASAEGVNTSQGSAITSLENTVNHSTTGLASKASSTALTAVDNKVTTANGRIDTTNSNVTALTGRVSTVEGAVSTKAEASALTALTTRVTNAEGVNTSQGSAITTLQNTINHATTGLATKASSSALTVVDNKVTAANGRIDATNSNVTTLTGRVSTVENGLTTKADVSAVNALTTRVGNVEGGLSTQASDITSLKSSIAGTAESITANGSQATIDTIGLPATNVLLSANTDSMAGSLIKLKGQVRRLVTNSRMLIDPTKLYKLRMRFRRTAGTDNRIYIAVINYNASGDRTVTAGNTLNPVGTLISSAIYPISDELPALNVWREATYCLKGKSTGASTGSGTLASPKTFPALAATVDIGVLANYNKGNDLTQEYEIDYLIFEDATAEAANDANASAISTTNTEVSRINGVVSGHTTQLSNLTASIAGKADTSALNALTVRVEAEEGKSSTQATSITNLSSKLNVVSKQTISKEEVFDLTGLDSSTYYPLLFTLTGSSMSRMRVSTILSASVNGKPAWSTHVEGFSCMFDWESIGSAWGANAVTRTINVADYSYTSGNQAPAIDITQFTNSSNECIYLRGGAKYTVGYSDGASNVRLITASTTISSQTVAPIAYRGDLKVTTSLNSKASASALSTLDTKVTAIDGKVTTQASQLSALSTTVDGHTTSIATQTSTIDGIQAKHTVKINNNGFVTGYGLISTANNGAVVSAFKVDADAFAVGKSGSGILPFVVTTAGQTINGIKYPAAGTWINSAYIANATIGLAHINKASIGSLSAISANLGTMVSLANPSYPDGERTVMTGAKTEVYDAAGRLVMRLGRW